MKKDRVRVQTDRKKALHVFAAMAMAILFMYAGWGTSDVKAAEIISADTNLSYLRDNTAKAPFIIQGTVTINGDDSTVVNGSGVSASPADTWGNIGLPETMKPKEGDDQDEAGFIYVTPGSALTINRGKFENFNLSRVIYVAKGATLTINGTTFKDNMGKNCEYLTAEASDNIKNNHNGMAICAKKSGVITINNAYFLGNSVTEKDQSELITDESYKVSSYGGAIYINQSAGLTVNMTTFSSNEADCEGGALFLRDCTATFKGCTFETNKVYKKKQVDNNATPPISEFGGAGAAIAFFDSYGDRAYELTVKESCTFYKNNAALDGTISYQSEDKNSKMNILKSTFTENTAGNLGGGIAAMCWGGVEVNITDSEFNGNIANGETGEGGAAYITGYLSAGNVNVNILGNTILDGNTATYGDGGGASIRWANVNIGENVEIKNNKAEKGCGGGLVLSDSKLTMTGGNLIGNIGQSGGGIYGINAALNLTGCDIKNNTANRSGGGIYADSMPSEIVWDTITVMGNTSNSESTNQNEEEYGGAGVALLNSNVSIVGNSQFSDNTSETRGGAISCVDSTLTLGDWTVGERLNFSNNTANGNGNGGGGVCLSNSTGNINNVTFDKNKALSQSSYGGAIYAYRGSVLNIGDKDAAETPVFTNNAAGTDALNSLGCGGAVMGNGCESLKIQNTVFDGNSANTGGAIYSYSLPLTISDNTVIKNNTATRDAGGAYIGDTASSDTYITSTINNTDFTGNTSGLRGGAIATRSIQLISKELKVENNTAKNAGGGIFLGNVNDEAQSPQSEFTKATIRNNQILTKASLTGDERNYGGGIAVNGTVNCDVLMDECIIENNMAGNETSDPAYGGGIGILCKPGLVDGTSTVKLRGCTVEENSSKTAGGGIYQYGGTLSMQDTNADGNTSKTGGGIYTTGRTEIENAQISNNYTTEDGAGIVQYDEEALLYLKGVVSIVDNKSGTKGGGLYVGNTSKVYIQGKINITNNKQGLSAAATDETNTKNSNVYLICYKDVLTNAAVLTVNGPLDASTTIGVSSFDPIDGRVLVVPDKKTVTSLPDSYLALFSHDAQVNKTSEKSIIADGTEDNKFILADTFTVAFDTDNEIIPLLYGGISKEQLDFSLFNNGTKLGAEDARRNQVTFTTELIGGFKNRTAAEVAQIAAGGMATAGYSGIVKVTAVYGEVQSENHIYLVVPGDLNKNGSIDLDDAVQMAATLRDDTAVKNYDVVDGSVTISGIYLLNMNTISDKVDVDDIVKIVGMVRGISDYYNAPTK